MIAGLIVVAGGLAVYRGTRPAPVTPIKLIAFSRGPALVAAERKGYFAAEHVQIEYTQTPSSSVQMRGLLDGKWDVAQTAPDNVMAYVEREKADAFTFLVGDLGINQKLIGRPEIGSIADLRGKAVGVDAVDTGFAFLVVNMLEKGGLNKGDYTFEPVGGTPERLAALKSGKTMAGLLSGAQEVEALNAGYKVLSTAAELYPNYPGSGSFATTKRWAAAHGDALVGFSRAYLKAVDWVADPSHRDEAIDLLMADQNAQRPAATAQYEANAKAITVSHPKPDQVLSGLQTVLDLRWSQQPGDGPKPLVTKYYDASYAAKAEGR
ncbi:MAG TPA: ABC transporter substrate-binding protein [Chloroflexota bacterium]|nr:ABC transporter substrate-binding protein [Chloroflexota bacterium]